MRLNAPYWLRSKRRWVVRDEDGPTDYFFVSEEAARKWRADPAANPLLPLKRDRQIKRKMGPLTVASLRP